MFTLAAAVAPTTYDQSLLCYLCTVFATVVGAVAGATAFSRQRMDVVGILACGTIASLGGGTVRDILLSGFVNAEGQPVTVYWMRGADTELLWEALGTSLVIFILARYTRALPAGTIRVSDAFSMAFFSLLGTAKCYCLGCPPIVCVCMGVTTGVAGGVLRDVLTGNVPYVFRSKEIYALASAAGCITFFIPLSLGGSLELSFIIGTLVVFATRMTAVWLNWRAPSYQPLFEKNHGSRD
ncbi:MAG: trimeric intracellular cation channel family protein [Akkermansia sp.]